jgi:LPXTG-site transpeptidase (sortase) family protein
MRFRSSLPERLRLKIKGQQLFSRLPWRNWRSYIPALLMISGILLLAYVGSEYFAMYREQKSLAVEWAKQENERAREVAQNNTKRAALNDGIIRLQIPKIDLDAYVLEGSGRKQLKLGVGRITTTALPGESGNAVVTAHRDTFFRHIVELKKGDEIIVRRNGERLVFQMIGNKIVKPNDTSVLEPTPDPTLTLITCYPTYYIGPAPERLIVTSKLVSRGPDEIS